MVIGMKKLFVIFIVLVIGFFFVEIDKNILIPDNAIRFRVIANSNLNNDQEIKKLVSKELQKELYKNLKDVKNIDDAREFLMSNTSSLEKSVEETLLKNNMDPVFDVNYGINHFPEKVYNGVEYKAGEYESLVVTLGEGVGDNWWCVLFPPVCLMEAEEVKDSKDIEYKFFVKELIDKYF